MIKHQLKEFFRYIYRCYYFIYTYWCEIKSLKTKESLWKNIDLTVEQEKQIQSVFGNKISNKWHRLYQSYTGNFNKDYFPEILFSTKLEPILCPKNICEVLRDKSLVEILYSSVPKLRLPKTIIVNCSGIFYDGDRNIINRETAISLIELWGKNNEGFVVKPTNGTHSGTGILICKSESNHSKANIMNILDRYKNNFIVQECIVNSRELRALYEKSLNTIRIMTYVLDDKLYNTPLIIRIGKGGIEVDNVGMGGVFIGVSEDGYLEKEAFTESGENFLIHPDSNIRFESFYIPNISKVIESAYACHKKTPHTKFISWDFTLDENNEPVLIEANMLGHTSWFPQAASGESLFGSNTKRMLEIIGIK